MKAFVNVVALGSYAEAGRALVSDIRIHAIQVCGRFRAVGEPQPARIRSAKADECSVTTTHHLPGAIRFGTQGGRLGHTKSIRKLIVRASGRQDSPRPQLFWSAALNGTANLAERSQADRIVRT